MSFEFLTHNQIHRFRKLGDYTKSEEGLIAYWDLQDPSGTTAIAYPDTAMNATHSNVTVNQPANTLLGVAVDYDSVANSWTNKYSAALASAFNPLAGTAEIIVKADSGLWTDGNPHFITDYRVDANNEVDIRKPSSDNQIIFEYKAGGISESITATGITSLDFMILTLTWDTDGAGAVNAYINGIQIGTEQTIAGTWAGPLSANQSLIGSGAIAPVNEWDGLILRESLFDRAKTLAEIKRSARLAGLL